MTSIEIAIARLTAVFGEPKTTDPETYVDDFRKALAGVEGRLVEKAVDRWMKRETPYWPRPGELRAEVEHAASEIYGNRPAEHKPIEARSVSPEQKARIAALVREAVEAISTTAPAMPQAKKPQWERGQRHAFEDMQRTSPNRMHHAKGSKP